MDCRGTSCLAVTRCHPVLYRQHGQNLFDNGSAYAGEWGVDETLDGLARTQGLELLVVGIDSSGVRRMSEINPWDQARLGPGEGKLYLDFIVNVVKPLVDASDRTLPERLPMTVSLVARAGIRPHPCPLPPAGEGVRVDPKPLSDRWLGTLCTVPGGEGGGEGGEIGPG